MVSEFFGREVGEGWYKVANVILPLNRFEALDQALASLSHSI
jgi:hypothetical protein